MNLSLTIDLLIPRSPILADPFSPFNINTSVNNAEGIADQGPAWHHSASAPASELLLISPAFLLTYHILEMAPPTAMSKPWLFVSPASRGIGFQLARRLLKTTDLPVIATARRDLDALKEQILDGLVVDKQRLEVLKLDVTGTWLTFTIHH